jgi:hypothetical protein
MLFPKAILQAEFAANAPLREVLAINESDGGRSGRRSKSDSYHEKRGGPLAGRKPPRRETQVLNVAEISRSRCQQQQSSPRSATRVNPSAEAIFWTTELTILSDKDRSRACIPGCLSEKSAISRRSTRSVTQSRAIRSNKIIRSFAILNNVPRYLLIPLLGVNLSDERSEDQQQSSDQNS